MNPALKRFKKQYGEAADAVARLDIHQTVREQVADALTDAFAGQKDFSPDLFRLLASDPLCACVGPGEGVPCPYGREIRVGMHNSDAPDGRSRAWASSKPEVRCVTCGAFYFGSGVTDDSPATRTVLVHLNVEVPKDDERDADEIASALAGALEVGSDDDSVRELRVVVPLAEEV